MSTQLSTYIARTPAQAFTFSIIQRYFDEFHCVPSTRTLSRLAGWSSHNAGAKAIRRLISTGLLEKHVAPDGKAIVTLANQKLYNKRKSIK